VLFAVFALALFRSRRGYWTRAVRRLRQDLEDVQ
jgi:hypothetical protein